MENFGKAMQYAGTAANSTGTSLKKMQAYTDSLEGSVNTLKASLQELWASIADSKVLINIVKSLNSMVQKLNELDWDKMTEFLKTAAKIAAVAFVIKTIVEIVTSIAGVVSAFQGIAVGATTIAGAITALGGLGSVLIPVIGIIGAITAAIVIASGALDDHTKKIENLQKEIDKLNDKEKEEIKLFKQYQELMSKSKIYNLTAQEKENLKNVSEQLVDIYGLEASGVDDVTGAYILNNKALEDNIEKLRKQRHELLLTQQDERAERIKKEENSLRTKSKGNGSSFSNSKFTQQEADAILKIYKNISNQQVNKELAYDIIDEQNNNQKSFDKVFEEATKDLTDNRTKEKLKTQLYAYRSLQLNTPGGVTTEELKKKQAKYLSELEQELQQAVKNYNSELQKYIQDMQDDIISQMINIDNVDVSANAEEMIEEWTKLYIQIAHEAGKKSLDIENDLIKILEPNINSIEGYAQKKKEIDERLISEDVTLQDYQNYFNNEAQKLALLKKIFGEKSETYQKYFSTLETKRSSDLGLQFLDISTILSNAGDATTQFNTLSNALIQLKTQFENGKISFNQYISDMNKTTENLKLGEIFGQNTEAAGKFLDSLSQHGIQNLDYLTDQFNNGSIETKDYVKNLGELATYFTQLNTAASSFLGSNYDSTGINDALTDIQTKLEGLENTLPTLTMSFTDFSKMSAKQVNDLAKALDALGIKTAEINGKTITGAKNIVKEAQKSSQGMQDLQATVAEAGSQLLYDFGMVAGNIVSKIANYISSFTLTLPSLQSIIAQVGSSLFTGKDVKINASVESNGIDVSSADFKKAIDAYAVKESGLGFRKENGGFTEVWDQAKQTAYNQIVKEAYADVQQNANNAIKYTLPYDLMQTGKNLFSNLNILGKSTGGNKDDDDDDKDVNTSVSEYEKYYSKLYQDLLEAILKDKQQAIKDFEEKNDKLDKDLDHALELKNINNAKGIYQNIRKNQQEYEDELKEQIKWTENQINQVLIPRINQLAPQFAISSIDELTNEQEQIIKNYYEAELEAINKDIFLLEKLEDENITEANKQLYISQLSNTDLAKNVKQSKQLKEDQKNDLEYKQTALNTTINDTRTAQDWDKSLKESLKESQRDISAYKKTLEGMYDIKSNLIEEQVKKLALAPDEALKSYKQLFDYLKSEFYPRSIEEAEYYANRLNTLLSEDLDRNKDYMNQMYQYAGTIKDYEVSLLEAQIDEYDEQINKLQEKKDLLKDNNALIEAETRLRNAQREKNKRVYREGLT